MSSALEYDTTVDDSFARPAHHVHKESEPLPATAAHEYDAYAREADEDADADMNDFKENDTNAVVAGGQHEASSGRPLGVRETPQGGVAIDGRDDLPEGKAKLTDKLVGKTQKLAGKATKNQDMHERGELREAGGKAAAMGEARVPHD